MNLISFERLRVAVNGLDFIISMNFFMNIINLYDWKFGKKIRNYFLSAFLSK